MNLKSNAKHYNIRFHGRVQGVFFRDFIKRNADMLGIKGFVRNEPDGIVYTEAEGEQGKLEEFLKLCKKGPQSAKVDKVETEEGELKHFEDFVIEY